MREQVQVLSETHEESMKIFSKQSSTQSADVQKETSEEKQIDSILTDIHAAINATTSYIIKSAIV